MDRKNFALKKHNYFICTAAVVLIITGFVLMLGPSSSIEGGFEPDIFSTRRIMLAPAVCFIGFLLMIAGILYTGKKEKNI